MKLRSYLLTQRKELPNIGAMPIDSPDEESNEEVRFLPRAFHSFPPTICSALAHIPFLACFLRPFVLFTVRIEVLRACSRSRAATPAQTQFEHAHNLTCTAAVCCKTTDGSYVSWKWGQCRPSYTISESVLCPNALQCADAFIPRVSEWPPQFQSLRMSECRAHIKGTAYQRATLPKKVRFQHCFIVMKAF